MVNRRRGVEGVHWGQQLLGLGSETWGLGMPLLYPYHTLPQLYYAWAPHTYFTVLINCACVLLKSHTILSVLTNNRPYAVSNHPKNKSDASPTLALHLSRVPPESWKQCNAEYSLVREFTLLKPQQKYTPRPTLLLSCEIMEVLQSKALFENSHNKSIHHAQHYCSPVKLGGVSACHVSSGKEKCFLRRRLFWSKIRDSLLTFSKLKPMQ